MCGRGEGGATCVSMEEREEPHVWAWRRERSHMCGWRGEREATCVGGKTLLVHH